MIREERFKHDDFYVVRPTSPTSTPPSFPGLRIPLSKPPRLQMLTLDFQGVNEPLQQEIIPNLLTQVYPNTYNYSKQNISNLFCLSQYLRLHNDAQYVNR